MDFGLVLSIPVPMLVVDESLHVRAASRSAYMVLGLRLMPGEVDQDCEKMTGGLQTKKDLFSMIANFAGKKPRSGKAELSHWLTGDRAYNITVSVVANQTPPLYCICFTDVTEHFAMQKSSTLARSYLESVLASLPIGVIVTDADLRITNMNSIQEKMLAELGQRVSMLDTIGTPYPELFADENQSLSAVIAETLEKGTVYAGIVVRLPTQAGEERVMSVSLAPLQDHRGAVSGLIRICEDITEKEKMVDELHRAELQAAEAHTIKKLVITLNHQINNALTSIIAAVSLLESTHLEPEDMKEMLKAMSLDAQKIADVTYKLRNIETVKTVEYLTDGPEMIDTD